MAFPKNYDPNKSKKGATIPLTYTTNSEFSMYSTKLAIFYFYFCKKFVKNRANWSWAFSLQINMKGKFVLKERK